jgi:O-antigen/teichoic acid export membrane protein
MISMILGGTFAIILLMAPEFFLDFYGKGFNESALSMRILVTAQVFNIACGSVGMLLAMTGHHALLMKILVSSMILDIVLNAVFIPQWGMAGAAMATAIAIMSWNLLALMMVRHHLSIRPTFGGLF